MARYRKAVMLILGVAVTAGVIPGIWLYSRRPPVNASQPSDSNYVSTSEATSTGPASEAVPSQSPSTVSEIPGPANAEPPEKIWEEALKTPIQFYGKVVDEKGNPIERAKATISFADDSEQGNTKVEKLTDGNGTFSISGHGLAVGVTVSKKGYYRLEQSHGSFGYARGAGTGSPHPNPQDPAVFVLRKMGNSVPLIKVEKYVRIRKDGTPVELNLTSGSAVAAGQGDIRIEAWTADQNHAVNSPEAYDWHCRLTVPNGGLTQRTNRFDFEAPSGGYAISDEINMPASLGPKWRHNASREYFVNLSGGRYARIEFEMMASGDHLFAIKSYLNPQPGSHNLEFDAEKAVKPEP